MVYDSVYLNIAILIFILMNMMFFLAILKKDNSIIDIFWGLGFVVINAVVFYYYPKDRGMLLPLLVTIWGVRLSVYLFMRWLKKGEDWRYAAWRKEWGKAFYIRSYFQVFMLQGVFMLIVALPLLQLKENAVSFSSIQVIATIVALFGWVYETIADGQLYQFKKRPRNKGKVMKKGLWKYSRHPNYFGEIIFWWGIFMYTIPYANIGLSLISPITITILLMKVSGVPMLESKYKNHPEYQEYIQTTNALWPKIPKAR